MQQLGSEYITCHVLQAGAPGLPLPPPRPLHDGHVSGAWHRQDPLHMQGGLHNNTEYIIIIMHYYITLFVFVVYRDPDLIFSVLAD